MNNYLEKLYEINFEKFFPKQRKVEITNSHTLVKGSSKSGKSYLIYDYLKRYKSEQYLYINLNDFRFDTNTILYNLDKFITNNTSIKVLALDNCEQLDITMLNVINDISQLTSIILSSSIDLSITNYNILKLSALDFEEYILFDTKHQNTTNSFNSFLKYGNLPEIIQVNENNKMLRNQEILKLITNNQLELNILKLYLLSCGELKSIFQLFNSFKKFNKISKDMFYQISTELGDKGIIYFCQKYNSSKAPKKIFTYNHAMINSITLDNKFNNILLNMIFLELKTHFINIYYLDSIDFYIEDTNSIIMSIPFFTNHMSILEKLLLAMGECYVENITIITINNEQTFKIGDIECEVLPFYSWSLGL